MKLLVYITVFLSLAFSTHTVYSQASHAHHAHTNVEDSEGSAFLNSHSIYHLESTWADHQNITRTLGDFHGSIHVVAMIYTGCEYVCPVIVNDIKNIEAALPKNLQSAVQFTLVSFDTENDTPAVLKKYAEKLSLGGQWTLLSSTPGDVLELATILGVKYQKDKNGGYSHSNIITVLDKTGVIRYQQNGLNKPATPVVSEIKKYINQ